LSSKKWRPKLISWTLEGFGFFLDLGISSSSKTKGRCFENFLGEEKSSPGKVIKRGAQLLEKMGTVPIF
jgi:hypothetical protein